MIIFNISNTTRDLWLQVIWCIFEQYMHTETVLIKATNNQTPKVNKYRQQPTQIGTRRDHT